MRKNWRISILVVAALTVLATPVLVGATQSTVGASKSQRTIRIGVLESETGTSASACLNEIPAIKLAIARFKGAASFKLIVQDDQSTPADGALGYRTLIGENVDAVIGPCFSVVGLAVYPLIDPAKTPTVFTTDGGDAQLVAPTYAFGSAVPSGYYTYKALQVLHSKGLNNVYMIDEPSVPTLVSIQDSFQSAIAEYHMNLVGTYAAGATDTTFTTEVEKIAQLNPGVVIADVRASQLGTFITELRSDGLTTQVVGTNDDYITSVLTLGGVIDQLLLPTNFATVFTYPSSKAFTKAYALKYNTEPTVNSATGYDAMLRVLTAINTEGAAKVAESSTAKARGLIEKGLLAQKGTQLAGAQGPLRFEGPHGDARTVSPGGVIEITNAAGFQRLLKPPTSG